MESLDFFFLLSYLFIFIWLHRVLIVAHGIFELCCNVGESSFSAVGSSSLTKGRTQAPCIGRVKS